MPTPLTAVDLKSLSFNPFTLLRDDTFLLTAGTPDHYNTMTAGWGGLGVLWQKPVAMVYVRPQRHTYGFINESATFSCSFFLPEHKKALAYCGSHSGRDVDKAKEAGLTALAHETGGLYFAEANLVFLCRKLYEQDLDPACFKDTALREQIYPTCDYHRLYVGEIVATLVRL